MHMVVSIFSLIALAVILISLKDEILCPEGIGAQDDTNHHRHSEDPDLCRDSE